MSALFDFKSLLQVIVLMICTCTYLKAQFPKLFTEKKEGFMGLLWKMARIGERLSPYVSACCFIMAITTLFF
ncbi:unnamed protein product [Vitrella brassicaformis CCMP3155]|uniref:Protein kish n=1 Tax=Vitrella brassicaformis (strain CCMP3155) TaxID=1169540 RepID=A0A0G4EAL3_VITBC|nr:unnamed protein product [Vitrella brassicaformis CCMP3155]|eukprot:CEL92672.1 unnamed protein product [Vitrella brassicaformis CCMP3155]